MKTRILMAITGLAFVIGPWVLAFAAVSKNSQAGKDGGVWEGATYQSVITLPIGLVLIILSIVLRPRW